MTDTTSAAWGRAAEFNSHVPKGTAVLAYPGTRDDEPLLTRTRSSAWALPSGDAVVMVRGHAGGIALTHIDVDETKRPVPPELEFRCPECPMCGKETDSDGDGFRCYTCKSAWGRDGTEGEWDEWDEPGCPSVIEWFNYPDLDPKHENLRHTTERCILAYDHGTKHRGFDEWTTWEDGDPRVLVGSEYPEGVPT